MADEQAVVEALIDLARQEREGRAERLTVSMGPFTAFSLIGMLQLLWRHPEMTPTQRTIIEDIARPLQTAFGPPLAETLECGWDRAYDVDPSEGLEET